MNAQGGAPVRVYVPTTWDRLPALRAGGLGAGTEGYAATEALASALGLPSPASSGEDGLDDLHEAAAQAAADASLLLLLADVESRDGTGAAPAAPARRAVLAVDAAVRDGDEDSGDEDSGDEDSGDDGAHPAAVRLAADAPWSSVAAVLADDERDEEAVREALERAGQGATDAALDRLEDVALGWFAPSEVPWPPDPPTP